MWSLDSTMTDPEIEALAFSRVKRMPLQIRTSELFLYLPLDDYPEGHGTLASTTWKDLSGNGNDGSGTDADGDSDVVAESVLSYP